MAKKNGEIIEYVLKQYIDLYDKKDIFNGRYFKINKEDVQVLLNNLSDLMSNENCKNDVLSKNSKRMSQSIMSINNEEDVEKYYLNNLTYKHDDENGVKNVLKHISAVELKYLYKILYKVEIKGKLNKTQILNGIEKYFENKNRVLYLKGL